MFTLKINFLTATDKYSKWYCRKFKRQFVLSDYRNCALEFKNMASAKRSFNNLVKSRGSWNNITGYEISMIEK